ncbi:adenosine 3'-phospho 5'-phosphosulfate transporter 1 isoform X1 [Maniola hyperantus]|uniref:adenosine 3'-phospho 5'-phosphosulfate transporter 1 isoform X1 n=1 Tax=Aphantopus hyperantus TaxID=2795564 RepID=UPI00156910E0|nr:adenosine 3'-phospho 5'-phosphosulfate transporter 1 [Maniola hyperantus]
MRSKIIIGLVLVLCVLGVLVLGQFYHELLAAYEQAGTLSDSEYSWVFRLLLNLFGYSTVLVPCYVLYKYLERTNYFDKITNQTWVSRALFACFSEHDRIPEAVKPAKVEESPQREGLELAFCFTGLMGAYLVWGLLQEKIMTQNYAMPDGTFLRFNDSQFLVFINRLLGFLIALTRLLCTRQQVIAAPLYKFSYCSLTNIISAWCQYEALKYVSFPTQVLSKSCKVIPVMLMGKLISRNKYEPYEYGTALLISVGMMLFMFGSQDQPASWGATSASGICLLALYMWCDSFTSSWQGALFRRHSLQPLQMLCAVNLCSCALTAAALLRARPSATPRLLQNPMFVSDCALLSVSSALGQLLIYRTIARFGPVVFTIIMTLRQAVSILVSCAVFGHAISAPGALGIVLVFAAVLLRVRCRTRKQKPPAQPA